MDYKEKNVSAKKNSPAVTFDNVTFCYQNSKAPSLSNISFSVKPGQTVGIIGGTGSGKSTLVSLITRFYDASEGKVLVDGVMSKIIPAVRSAVKSAWFPRKQLFSREVSVPT